MKRTAKAKGHTERGWAVLVENGDGVRRLLRIDTGDCEESARLFAKFLNGPAIERTAVAVCVTVTVEG